MNELITGALFKRMVLHGAAAITVQKQAINDLNVFPVPDGDTGTNMSMTIGTAVTELRKSEPATVEKAASITASALLRGARGNSGVILSLLFRGISKGLKGMETADAASFAAALQEGQVMLLENTRYIKGETKNDPELSKQLASLADIFVNDAFGTAHRAHSSTAGVADYLPAVCGYLVQKEVSIMGKALANPERPFVAILGGAKVSDKLNVINNLLEKVDTLIIGGGMAYTFLAAKGYSVGTSLLDSEKIDYCKEMMAKAEAKGVKLLLPIDTVVASAFPDPIDGDIAVETVPSNAIPADKMGLDIGEKTRELFAEAAKSAKTVVWNGPMGVFENPTLAKGTIAVAQALADSSATTIVGGGDSAAACEQLGFADKITHISTGGGASLEFLEGLELPGIACLEDK